MLLRFFTLLCLLTLAAHPPVSAQIPFLPQTGKNEKAAAPPSATPGQTEETLRKALADARAKLAKLNEPTAEATLPEGVPPAELADRRQDLDQLVRTMARHLSLFGSQAEAAASFDAAKQALTAWTGFTETPPYSILLVDDLATRLDLTREKKSSYESSVSLFERSLDGVAKSSSAVKEAAHTTTEALLSTENPTEALRWAAEAAAIKQQLLIARADSLRANIELLNTQISTVQAQDKLLEKQLLIARSNSRFTEEDLTKLKKAAADRQATIRKEIAEVEKKQKAAQAEKVRAKNHLDRLQADKPEAPTDPEIELARTLVDAADLKVDTLLFISENLSGLEGLATYLPTAYQNRRTLREEASRPARDAALASLTSMRDRLSAWEVVSTNELSAVNADLSQLGTASADSTDPRSAAMASQRATLWEKQNFILRASQDTGRMRKQFDRWVAEAASHEKKSIGAHVTDTFTTAWARIRAVWEFPVSKYTVDTGAGPIQKSVKLGAIIKALLFFGIAYYIASKVSRRLQRLLIHRVHIGEAQASTMRNWLMILVGIGLAIATLNFLSIPLTLFAFFGGALAIGLGFGTQTLIKNFISGIIVLFERKIRVGDIVDIGGLSGSITEINTRSSVLRGADGRETLVPNSVFLENRITNLTLSNRRVRKLLLIKAAYGSSPQQVIPILLDCVERHGLILKEPEPIVTLEEFADAALVFGIYYWTEFNAKTNGDVVASDIRLMVEKRFAEAGIALPTPTHEFPLKTDQPLEIRLSRKMEDSPAAQTPKPARELP